MTPDELSERIAELLGIGLGEVRCLVRTMGFERARRGLMFLMESPGQAFNWLSPSHERVSIQYHAEHIAQSSGIDVEQAQQLVLLHGPRVAMQQALSWPGPMGGAAAGDRQHIQLIRSGPLGDEVVLSIDTGSACEAEPCHSCANYEGRTYHSESGEPQPPMCCAMYPYGPESDECPDWEDKTSPDARRRKLQARHARERSVMEARHRKECEQLEADISQPQRDTGVIMSGEWVTYEVIENGLEMRMVRRRGIID